ncbi:MAG TPA: glycosyltransferase family 2 protein [Gammaproteobacteria bacterium]|nr:glycosyltransferase family 2 protein [Gammaproteobacteria bacterium]
MARQRPKSREPVVEQRNLARPSLTVPPIIEQPPGNLCALIPVYNNHQTLLSVIEQLRQYIQTVIIIDDGSDDGTEHIVDQLAATCPESIHIQHHASNRGKGAAVQTGLQLAATLGFDDALQVDADGQHNLDDIPIFLQARKEYPKAMIMGAPIFDDSIPASRKYGRKLTHLMIALESGSGHLPDAMCGFRLYPIATILQLGTMGSRMCFDPEVMIRADWANIPIKTVPTKVRYLSAEEGGVSHFKMFHDNLLHVWTHTRLLLQAPLRWLIRWIKR